MSDRIPIGIRAKTRLGPKTLLVYLATPHSRCSMKHQLSFRSTILERTKWLMGVIKLVGRLPPVPLPEYDSEDLPDIEEEEQPLPPGTGSIPLAPITAEGAGATADRGHQPPPPKHRKPKPQGPATSSTTLGTLHDLTEDSHATSRGPSSGSTLPLGLQDIIQRMLPSDQARALHLLQQMGPATGNLAPIP